jgi:3-phosphoshikimate 1-carboxyvinyltransferase
MRLIVYPGNPIRGCVEAPGDKSLSHRAVLLATLAEGESRIENFLVSGVTQVMLDALTALGVPWRLEEDVLTIQGRELKGLKAPEQPIHCGNSATTLRLLAGLLAAAGIPAILDGSAGLRRRPMLRIVEPLLRMGVPIDTAENGCAPLVLRPRPAGHQLMALDEDLPIASAQVKSCLLLASLAANGETVLREPGPSRDHTERMLGSLGVPVTKRVIEEGRCYETRLIPTGQALRPFQMRLPGDFSAAAFLVTAAAITPGSSLKIMSVGLNPTRTGLIDALRQMGADIQTENIIDQGGEPAGDVVVHATRLHGGWVGGPLVVRMIDEFSIFGVAAASAEGQTVVQDASELRYKESDRIHTLCQELGTLGVEVREAEDGFTVMGGQIAGGQVDAHGDHRLAMAMAVAGLVSQAPVCVEGAEIIDESFPGFVDSLKALGAAVEERPSTAQ